MNVGDRLWQHLKANADPPWRVRWEDCEPPEVTEDEMRMCRRTHKQWIRWWYVPDYSGGRNFRCRLVDANDIMIAMAEGELP